jgi:hypothetical protein
VLALPAASACVSYGQHLTASPLPKGQRELSLNADALVVDRGFGAQVLPNPELGYRVGVGRDWDLGGRVNAGSLETNARWRFARGFADWALVPGLGFGFVPVTNQDTGLFNAHLLTSVLSGLHVGERSQLVLGVRGALTYAFPLTAFRGDASGDTLYYLGGGVLGIRFPIGRSAFLFPELNLLCPYDSRRSEWLLPTLQGGVALQL